MEVPAVVIGAAVAALLTGLFSFINLTMSKEVKISEARLAWNDALRVDLSEMIAGIETLTRLAEAQLNGLRAKDRSRDPKDGFTKDEYFGVPPYQRQRIPRDE